MPRHKQPLEVAKLKGSVRDNPQRYKLDPAKSAAPLGEMPSWLSESARAFWFELEANAPAGVLTGADRLLFATLCELAAELRDDPREMPAARIGQMVGLAGRFGLSPGDRQKIGTPKGPEGNPFDEFN